MKMKITALLLCLALALMPVCAYAADDHQSIIDGALGYAKGDLEVQNWVDEIIAPEAGSAMDNYIINLNHQPNSLDFSAYIASASAKLNAGEINNPVTRMRCALALISCGAMDAVPAGLADETIGKLGVMSYIFGLHLLNNGLESGLWSVDSLVEKLLSMQKADGGWAVMGNFGDVDVTAMCIQALAGLERTPEIESAIEQGLKLLSERQLENGGFASTGHENVESAAQVIIAAAALGVDPSADVHFIKNGTSAVDALLAYRMEDGGFKHQPVDNKSNETASLQAMQALCALSQSGQPYYILNLQNAGAVSSENTSALPAWKLYALIGIAAFAVAGSIYALTRRHGRGKQFIFVVGLAAVLVFAVYSLNFESADDYYSKPTSSNSSADGKVYLSIRCDVVAGEADDGITPEDGVILERCAMPFSAGDTVFKIITDAARQFEIQMEHEGGTGDMAYINGINYLYEYAYGELSGWMYYVNGVRPSVGCGAYEVQNGDEIVWHYTRNMGEDLE